ncbi:MAG: TolC family protein [Alphaproteobacteria bacterium]|nr:TolC family protein [Alphaproteobacteria bacterium]
MTAVADAAAPLQLAQAAIVGAPSPAAAGERSLLQSTLRELLVRPLAMEDAVRVVLLGNRRIQSLYFETGLGEAEIVAAVNASRSTDQSPGDVERSFVVAAFGSKRGAAASEPGLREAMAARLTGAAAAYRLAARVRKTYAAAVAAQQTVRYFEQVGAAAESSAELTRRMVRIGNLPRLSELREDAFSGEVFAQLARARQNAVAARERLVRLLGLWGSDAGFALPDRLLDLPTRPLEIADVEGEALRQRLDLHAHRLEIVAKVKDIDQEGSELTQVLAQGQPRYIEIDEFDYLTERGEIVSPARVRAVRVPLFDRAFARTEMKARSLMRKADRFSELAIDARSEAREAYLAYRTAYDVARHYRDKVVPARKQISDEMLLRYNGMLVSVFDLLSDSREQVASVLAAIEAMRGFWVAEAELRLALVAGADAEADDGMSVAVPASGGKAH